MSTAKDNTKGLMIYSQSPSPLPPSPLTVTIKTTIKDMLKNHEQSDFSGFSPQHPMFQDLSSDEIEYLRAKKAKKVGVMKDEINGYLLLEYVGIRPKAYSLKYEKIEFYDEDGEISKKPTNQSKAIVTESEKLKGIKRGTVEKTIHYEHFLDCINNDSTLYSQFNTFRSYNHKLKTITQNKLALCNYDDKRWIMNDGINTLAYGHYEIKKFN